MPFLAPLAGPILGGAASALVGGMISHPQQQAASQAAGQASVLDNLLAQQAQAMMPYAQQVMKTLGGLTGSLPIQDIVQSTIMQEMLPTIMPQIFQGQIMGNIQAQTQNQLKNLQQELAARGIDPNSPAGQALLNQVRETGLLGQAQAGTDIGTWEAQQTLANQRSGMQDVMNLLGMTGSYAAPGANIAAAGQTGAMNLAGFFGNQAQQAAAPWMQLGQQVGQKFGQGLFPSLAQPPTSPSTDTGYTTTGMTSAIPTSSPMPPFDMASLSPNNPSPW